MNIITMLLIGLIAGWLASVIMTGRGFGLLGDIIVGIVGALIGGLLFGTVMLTTSPFANSVITALLGAIILLLVISLVRRTEVT
jgi:uncharacterized membrane protein YeaQ/YmgE (transglycosylase-associated protein family)